MLSGLTFSTFGRVFFQLDDYFTTPELLHQIDVIDRNYMGGHTNTAHGFQLVLENVRFAILSSRLITDINFVQTKNITEAKIVNERFTRWFGTRCEGGCFSVPTAYECKKFKQQVSTPPHGIPITQPAFI